ncbi:myosin-VIIa-like isoform X2 [Orbicella faveolata]|uniref:myosin-VIIa-like isoform X2 n=1 Tax=Orbicella faveolata TaxID=48498 RepID=UPI0009E3EEA5|nr:myosin-VIIa-like isoform X2 [Orbicella faveolata]
MSSLLSTNNVEDRKASCAISVAILRFMRDMGEPKFEEEDTEISETTEITSPSNKAYSSGTTFKRKVESQKAQTTFVTSHNLPALVMMNRCTTNIEKVQFIASFGIRRPPLRDEIYCQICRQLVKNGSQTSFARGWILLALCVGVFPPSDKLLNYLTNFLKQGPGQFGDYCHKILQRTLQVGFRKQPPTTVELEAVKTQSPLNLPVIFMDGSTKTFEVDPAITCAELCLLIKNKLGLRDIFGFSIFIEALTQQQQMISIIAKRYYIENGHEIKENLLRQVVQDSFPPYVLTTIAEDDLIKSVKDAFNASSRIQERSVVEVVKKDIVNYAATHWFKEFSRMFDGFVASGPNLPKIAVRLAFNSQGLLVFSSENRDASQLLSLSYSQIKKASSLRKGMYLDAVLMLTTSRSTTYSFRSLHADNMNDLINHFLKYSNGSNIAGVDD